MGGLRSNVLQYVLLWKLKKHDITEQMNAT